MRSRFLRAAVFGLALGVIGWGIGRSSAPALVGQAEAAQAPGDGKKGDVVKAGRYQYVSGGLLTVIMVDTETNRTYALAPPMLGGPFERDVAEFAWVPITKF